MKSLSEFIEEVDHLSAEDRVGLTTHLIAGFQGAPLGPDEEEFERRETEIENGTADLLSHEDLCKAVGR